MHLKCNQPLETKTQENRYSPRAPSKKCSYAINIRTQFLWTYVFISHENIPRRKLVGLYYNCWDLCLSSKELVKLFFQVHVPYIPISKCISIPIASHARVLIVCLVNHNHFHGSVMVSYYNFDLHLFNA